MAPPEDRGRGPPLTYVPLDVESLLHAGGGGHKGSRDYEAEARHAEERAARRRRHRLVAAVGGAMIAAAVLLAVLLAARPAAVQREQAPPRGEGAAAAAPHALDKDGGGAVWNVGAGGGTQGFAQLAAEPPDGGGGEGFVPCVGPRLRCEVVNRLPLPEVDFRNFSRRAAAAEGMVAADNSRCSQVGRDVLAEGGHAADAAVAVALCLGVVNPSSSGLGGGAFITLRLANGSAAFWDARETAPAAATADMFAVAVPGELPGLGALHAAHGRLPWARLVRPAAELARQGMAAHPYLVYVMSGPRNAARIAASPGLREAFMVPTPGGGWRLPRVGELCCKRPRLADTLDKIAAEGPAYLNRPDVAAAMAAEIAAAGGIVSAADLQAAKPAVREPLRVTVGELELVLPPPPSSAAVVAFALQFLAGYGNTALTAGASNASSDAPGGAQPRAAFGPAPHPADGGLGLHRLVEAMKHGFAVRTALGDPGTPAAPFPHADRIAAAAADLLDARFAASLRAATRDDGVLPDEAYGGRWNPRGDAPPEERGTTHFSIVDAERNAVAVTTSVNGPFGSAVVSPSTGILLGNTMDDFAFPNTSSTVTPHASEANFIYPGRRPLSAMSPLVVAHARSGRLVATAGASGGPLIVSATLTTLARLLLEGADVGAAVSGARVHDQLLPRADAFFENVSWGRTDHQLPAGAVSALRARGQVTTPAAFALGVAQAIFVSYDAGAAAAEGLQLRGGDHAAGGGAARGVLLAASDARKDGAPLGY
ncbi:GGT2 [Scenedesmus sp. PABB004]|nr:GGT2 [Scenedesmus sp. PABB004]